MNPTGQLFLTFAAMAFGALLMLPFILLMWRLLTHQMTKIQKVTDDGLTSLTTIQFKNLESQTETLQKILLTLPEAQMRKMIQSQTVLLNGLLKPLLFNQEALVNRLIARTSLDVSQSDASLVSREAMSTTEEYIPMTDEAESQRFAQMSQELDDEMANLPGWDSTQS